MAHDRSWRVYDGICSLGTSDFRSGRRRGVSGNSVRNAGDDPLGPLLQVSNSGAFRYRGSIDRLNMVVLTTSMSDPDWPDALDQETGLFTYFGDNKRPGRALHDTPRRGNKLLRRVFDLAHGSPDDRARTPPILVFANSGEWRDVRFLGLAVPGAASVRPSEDLIAVWKFKEGLRFQNYRAIFTILDVAARTASASAAWKHWISSVGYSTPTSVAKWLQTEFPRV